MADELNISKIALLPKSEDRIRIQNYRPISLLNTLYKIVAKVYANRMKPLLHNWILPSQTGFVPNRCILDNVFLAFEAIAWTRENQQELTMLLLDFEKAYDRVNWTYLREVMAKMGFHTTWINQVMSLNENAAASVIVNGEISKTFRLQRSVRQGCPLAPYLFLLTVDVLGQMLQHPDCGVQGLRLPDNTIITNQMFADDTLLLLDGTRENLDKALNVIIRFSAASGAKLNLHKSVGLWLAPRPRVWQWGEEAGLKWLEKGEVTRYLGYPFGIDIPQKEKDAKMMSQIRKHLLRWSTNKLSLAGRIMVSNQVVLSSIWYLASCTDFSGKSLKLARAAVRNYMWSGKLDTRARARVKWSTAVLPIVRGGVKILDPEWQTSALLVKLLIRGMSVGYEPWKALVRHRVAQTKQSRRGRWPAHANWIMNAAHLVQQGSPMWQGVMKAWSTIQSGLEQQDPQSWSEIARQPLFGNRLLTSEQGVQWGTEFRTNMRWWSEKQFRTLQDIARPDWEGWRTFPELIRLRRTSVAPHLYARVVRSIPWVAQPMPPHHTGQWIAAKEEDGSIQHVYHLQTTNPLKATMYSKQGSEQLQLVGQNQLVPNRVMREVRVLRCGGDKRIVLDYNPQDETEADQSLWLWGNDWISNLEWDPRDWQWRRLGILPDTSVMNYTTKRGYRIALKQNTQPMNLDLELEREGYNSKARAKFFNRIWHPYLPRKVAAMQWLILTDGLPVGEWREKIGLPSNCELCSIPIKETLQHAFKDCPHLSRAWDLFRNTRRAAKLQPSYLSWLDISRGLMRDPPGPQIDEELRWDTASALSLNSDTPWDTLRAQLLWSIWCQKVEHTFRKEKFHLGVVLWHAWRNTIYCAMEAYKELFRHKRNEEKRQEVITCFQQIWTEENVFGRLQGSTIKWNITPHPEFLPKELGAWTAQPIRINRLSPSPDIEAEFLARPDFAELVDTFVRSVGNDWQPLAPQQGDSPNSATHTTTTQQSETVQSQQTQTSVQDTDPDVRRPYWQHTDDSTQLPIYSSHSKGAANEQQQGNSYRSPSTSTGKRETSLQHASGTEAELRCGSDDDASDSKLISRLDADRRFGHKEMSLDPLQVRTQLSTHITGANRQEPRSRPKRCCSKRLSHPFRRSKRGKIPHIPQDSPREEHSDFQQSRENREDTLRIHQEQTTKNKPSSRPKRKCRFGPRTRRLHRKQRKNGTHSSSFPEKPREDKGSHQGKAPLSSQELHAQTCSPTFTDFTPPQDRVKSKSGIRQPAVNTSRHVAVRLGIPEAEFEATLTKEINELLREIEVTCRGAAETTEQERADPQYEKDTDEKEYSREPTQLLHGEGKNEHQVSGSSLLYLHRTANRYKGKSYDGTKKQRGRERERTTSPRRDPPPSPPRTRTQVPTKLNNRSDTPPRDRTRDGHSAADWIRSDQWHDESKYEHDQQGEDSTQVKLPDRPTISHFCPARTSPFAHYLGTPPAESGPPPFRPVHTRLGISESEYEALLTSEIDEVLVAAEEDRRRARAPICDPPDSSAPPSRFLSKDDCLAYFRTHGYPTADSPGSLWGMYWWAANLGDARFNFEFDFDKDDLNILNAYD